MKIPPAVTLAAAAIPLLSVPAGAPAATVDAGEPFGALRVVDEIDCGAADGGFTEYPQGISRVETILGRRCRVLPNDDGDAKYVACRVGRGAGLAAGKAYLLCVEFPDDRPRSMFICNWGCETARGVHTGSTVGDVVKARYVNNNPESLHLPQSGTYLTWRQLFFLHDRTPEIKRPRGRGPRTLLPADGFTVIIAQPKAVNQPESAGAAVARIRLLAVPDPGRYAVTIRYPPAGLPRRHIFWREEMADGVISIGHRKAEKDPALRGVENPVDWYEYKVRLMQFLGINTFCKDLLEFGHNQGWDAAPYGGNGWYYQSATPGLWGDIITMLEQYPDRYVLPYYEYAGSIGGDPEQAIGTQRRCRRLNGKKDYTHIGWVHKTNADLVDPAFIEDARKVLDATINRYRDRVRFIGAWFRPRPEANPVSFNDTDLAIFAREANKGKTVTRKDLRSDNKLLETYVDWWYTKRRDFLAALAGFLRENVNPDAVVLYTTDASEPGVSLPSAVTGKGKKRHWEWKTAVVNDRVERWRAHLERHGDFFRFVKSVPYDRVVAEDMHLQALLTARTNWGKWAWHHACPGNDPRNYKDRAGILLTYSFHRLYSVASPKAFAAFTTPSGLAAVRHYPLNENEMTVDKDPLLGYFVADVERAGPYSMICEARAMAYGNPRFLGYLAGNSFNRGFPRYVRRFNAAFLSLPALPGTVAADAASDPRVVVRYIPAKKHGTWVAVVNTGLAAVEDVTVALPAGDAVTDAATGTPVDAPDNTITLSLYPGELRSLRVR